VTFFLHVLAAAAGLIAILVLVAFAVRVVRGDD
jgi:hypothetical protein